MMPKAGRSAGQSCVSYTRIYPAHPILLGTAAKWCGRNHLSLQLRCVSTGAELLAAGSRRFCSNCAATSEFFTAARPNATIKSIPVTCPGCPSLPATRPPLGLLLISALLSGRISRPRRGVGKKKGVEGGRRCGQHAQVRAIGWQLTSASGRHRGGERRERRAPHRWTQHQRCWVGFFLRCFFPAPPAPPLLTAAGGFFVRPISLLTNNRCSLFVARSRAHSRPPAPPRPSPRLRRAPSPALPAASMLPPATRPPPSWPSSPRFRSASSLRARGDCLGGGCRKNAHPAHMFRSDLCSGQCGGQSCGRLSRCRALSCRACFCRACLDVDSSRVYLCQTQHATCIYIVIASDHFLYVMCACAVEVFQLAFRRRG